MSTVKADSFTWKSGESGGVTAPTVTGEQVVRGVAKSWVNFNGSGGASARASFNVSSLTRNTTGDYSVTLTNAQIDANYAAVCVGGAGSAAGQSIINASAYNVTVAPTTTVYRFVQANASTGTQYDLTYINSVVLR